MAIFLSLLFGIYILFVLALLFGWARTLEREYKRSGLTKKISVVIPFRNESKTLPTLLSDLAKQTYPHQHLEVICVDDHSIDQSVDIARAFCRTHDNFHLLQLSGSFGKKAALREAINSSQGEIIVTTDADCSVPPNWLHTIATIFHEEDVKMAIGAVKIAEDGTFFGKLQALEFASLVGSSGATLGWGQATMCNGANLAFLKSAFDEAKGYEGNEHISSGDDEFLMRKFQDRWPSCIRFINRAEAVVTTAPVESTRQFVAQRVRWAGKWSQNSDLKTKSLAVVVWGFHLAFLIAWVAAFCMNHASTFFIGLIVSKMFVEAIFLIAVTRFLGIRWVWLPFLFLQVAYSFYVVSIGVWAQFFRPKWKGREVSNAS